MNKQEKISEDSLTWNKIVELEDGLHKGKIVSLTRSERGGFDYIDINIQTENKDKEECMLDLSVPCNLSDSSRLGKLLIKSGFEPDYETDYTVHEIAEHLMNAEVTFKTTMIKVELKSGEKIDKCEIMYDSVKFEG